MDVVGVTNSVVLVGETWVTIEDEDTLYRVLVEWTKLPDRYDYEEYKITRVEVTTNGEDKWYENGEWQDKIDKWEEILEMAIDAFLNS